MPIVILLVIEQCVHYSYTHRERVFLFIKTGHIFSNLSELILELCSAVASTRAYCIFHFFVAVKKFNRNFVVLHSNRLQWPTAASIFGMWNDDWPFKKFLPFGCSKKKLNFRASNATQWTRVQPQSSKRMHISIKILYCFLLLVSRLKPDDCRARLHFIRMKWLFFFLTRSYFIFIQRSGLWSFRMYMWFNSTWFQNNGIGTRALVIKWSNEEINSTNENSPNAHCWLRTMIPSRRLAEGRNTKEM